jgi:hypothetical protein
MPAALTDIQSDEYMRYAENCVKMAKVAINREDRIIQREMAAEWLRMANAGPSNGRSRSMNTMNTERASNVAHHEGP